MSGNQNDNIPTPSQLAARKRLAQDAAGIGHVHKPSPAELGARRAMAQDAAEKGIEQAKKAAERAAQAAEAALAEQKKAAAESSLAAAAAAKIQAEAASKSEEKAEQRSKKADKKIEKAQETADEKTMGTDFEGMYASLKKATQQKGVLTSLRRTKTVSFVADPIEAAIDRNIVQPTKIAFKTNIADPIAAAGNRAYQSVLSRFSGTEKEPSATLNEKDATDKRKSSATSLEPNSGNDINNSLK